MAKLQDILDNLVLQYEGYFDTERPHIFAGKQIALYARYTQRVEKYVLVRRAQLFATEINEHVFFVHVPYLDASAWAFEIERAKQAESAYVKPHIEHMYSYITLVLLCDGVEEAVKKQVRRLRYTKNYKFSTHGYSTVRVAVLNLGDETIVTNSSGKEVKKVLEKALHM